MPKFKYSEELDGIHKGGVDCPPDDATAKELVAYRWVKNPISDECFLPQAIRNPPRLHQAKDLAVKCSCWGLSFHDSLEASTKAYYKVLKSFPRFKNHVGGWIAKGELSLTDGISTPIEKNGHFDLHEYANSDLENSFEICHEIQED